MIQRASTTWLPPEVERLLPEVAKPLTVYLSTSWVPGPRRSRVCLHGGPPGAIYAFYEHLLSDFPRLDNARVDTVIRRLAAALADHDTAHTQSILAELHTRFRVLDFLSGHDAAPLRLHFDAMDLVYCIQEAERMTRLSPTRASILTRLEAHHPKIAHVVGVRLLAAPW